MIKVRIEYGLKLFFQKFKKNKKKKSLLFKILILQYKILH